jgi:hypothetical protein
MTARKGVREFIRIAEREGLRFIRIENAKRHTVLVLARGDGIVMKKSLHMGSINYGGDRTVQNFIADVRRFKRGDGEKS